MSAPNLPDPRTLVIVRCGGGSRWIGVNVTPPDRPPNRVELVPAWEYLSGPMADQRTGQLGWQRIIVPIESLASCDKVGCEYDSYISLAGLSDAECNEFTRLLTAAEAMRDQLRAAAAGLTLASSVKVH